MASVARSRLLALLKTQCRIFEFNYNPEGARLGNKVLRQRLRGPALASYYPRKTATIRDLQDAFKQHDMSTFDPEEEDRLESLKVARARGKGAPKKRRTAAESKSAKKRR